MFLYVGYFLDLL